MPSAPIQLLLLNGNKRHILPFLQETINRRKWRNKTYIFGFTVSRDKWRNSQKNILEKELDVEHEIFIYLRSEVQNMDLDKLKVKGGLLYDRAVVADDKLSKDYKHVRNCTFNNPVGDLAIDCQNKRPITSWMGFVATATLLLKTHLEKLLGGLKEEVGIYELRQKLFESIESEVHNMQMYGQSVEDIKFVKSTLSKGYEVIEFRRENVNSTEIMRGRVSFDQSEKNISAALDKTLRDHVKEVGGSDPCSVDCPAGSQTYLISHSHGLSKCWICQKCAENTYSSRVNSINCVYCKENELSVKNNTACEAVPQNFISFMSPEFVVGTSLGATAGAIKIATAMFIFVHRNRPVIKASDPVFCYLFLFSLGLGDLLTVLTLFEPSILACNTEFHVCALFVCSICSNLFYRSLKIYKIFMAAENFQRRPQLFKFLTREAQFTILLIVLGSTAVLTHFSIMNEGWVYAEVLVTHKSINKVCTSSNLIATCYPFILTCLLLVGTLFLAYKMRLFPHNFKETTTIFTTSLMIMVICLIFLSGYSISEPPIKSLLRAIIYFCISQIFLVCFFLPKIVILLKNEDLVDAARKQTSIATVVTAAKIVKKT